jgi:acetate kinase
MSDTILVVNAGSSSIKFQLFEVGAGDTLNRLIKGQIDGIGVKPRLVANGARGKALIDESWSDAAVPDAPAALQKVVQFLRSQLDGKLPVAIGHRIVHGGMKFREPTIVTQSVLEDLFALVPLAPLHQPNNLAPIKVVHQQLPELIQVGCFDTAFHSGHSEAADRFAIPESLYREGVRRYGFHGLSYEYVTNRLPSIAPRIASGKIIIAHLGSGASMCAISAGRSVESTMGFTALDGLPMGTRSGQIDPGVLLYLLQQKNMTPRELERFLYNDCGLKGLSGISNDVRVLLASDDPNARLALDYFVYRIVAFAGALAAVMGGLDGFVFTAGIGENAPSIREAIIRNLAWLGFELDRDANKSGGPLISTRASRIACYVVPTNEELMIARHTLTRMRERMQQL